MYQTEQSGQQTLDMAQQVLDAQPFSRLLGVRVTSFEPGTATLELDARDDLQQQNGFLHGGVLAFAADNALTFAGGSALGPAVLTAGFSISYLSPADGRTLRARGEVVHATHRQAVCRCDLYVLDGAGVATRCAIAQGTIAATKLPGDTNDGSPALG